MRFPEAMAKLFTNDKRQDSQRRSPTDRRGDSSGAPDERRSSDRRTVTERRSQVHGIEINTRKSLIEMEEFLDTTCDDYWSAILLDTDAASATKRYRLQFFSLDDRDRVVSIIPEAQAL